MTCVFAVLCDGPAEVERWNLQDSGLCVAFGLDELLYVDATKGGDEEAELGRVQFHERKLKARQVASLEAAVDEGKARGLRIVLVEGPRIPVPNAPELRAYRHPLDALYVFGGNRSSGLWPAFQDLDADWLTIDADRGIRAHQAAVLVAYERRQQQRARLR